MKFSIIIPVYNIENELPYCLDSAVNQSFRDYEIILIDDGSTDSSSQICDSYAKKYENTVCFHQINQGPSAARNIGLEKASGEWIVFVDGDDWIRKDMLEVLNRCMEEEKADLYSFNARKVFPEGKYENLLFSVENTVTGFYSEKDRFRYYEEQLMQYKVGWEVCFRVYKKEIIQRYDMKFSPSSFWAEDYLFTFQYLLYVTMVYHICDILYFYRQRATSSMNSLNMETVLPCLAVWAETAYQQVRQAKLHYFRKNYERLYFWLFNYHIQYLLKEIPLEKITRKMEEIGKKGKHRHWQKKIRKRREQYMEDMGDRIWL